MGEDTSGVSYSDAGVGINAGERAVALMRESVAVANRPEVVGGLGGFAGLFDASLLAKAEASVSNHHDRRRRHQSNHRATHGQDESNLSQLNDDQLAIEK
jgi:hypothetical protein